jgi:hypothetical protein
VAKLALLILLAVCVPTAFAATPITVAQAEQLLATLKGQPDTLAAEKISNLELTERATTARLARWQTEFPGRQSRDALLALADASTFLNLPADDMLSIQRPNLIRQEEILLRAAEYVKTVIPRLPRFFTTCSTAHFVNSPPEQQLLGQRFQELFDTQAPSALPNSSGPPPLRVQDRFTVGVIYRDGLEIVNAPMTKGDPAISSGIGVVTWGEFGPILSVIVKDSDQSDQSWSHWEQGPNGPLAVFRYRVPENKSNYQLDLRADSETRFPAYHGELAVDPINGAVFRATLVVDLKAPSPAHESAIMVEYGPVSFGKDVHICPVKGVALIRASRPIPEFFPQGEPEIAPSISGAAPRPQTSSKSATPVPVTYLNDVAFSEYELLPPELADQPTPATVEQVEQLLRVDHGQSERKVAADISRLKLTQRATSARLARWQDKFPGKHARNALLVLADASAFLKLPKADIPSIPMPDPDTRRQILIRMIGYVNTTVHKLPDFFASRGTAHFDDLSFAGTHALHLEERSAVIVTYRKGQEVVDTRSNHAARRESPQVGLTTQGEFGPILSVVVGDAIKGRVFWDHWEQVAAGPQAVFRYTVPQELSHYTVTLAGDPPQTPAYHGEIAIDPTSGTILRISVVADLLPPKGQQALGKAPEAAIMVEYGPVVIGDGTYTCPIKGVGLFMLPNPRFITQGGDYYSQGGRQVTISSQTFVNDVSFTQYHFFRTEVRILPSDSCGPQSKESPDCSN